MAHSETTNSSYTTYIAYRDPRTFGRERIGHLDTRTNTIQPLSFVSGTAITNLYQVIEVGEAQIKPSDEDAIPLSSVQLLPPINGRDVLAVGKNYFEHAIEFNTSGFDSSDKVDQPSHPVIFTKRATSIIAHGDSIFTHPGFTETSDYEGEIGVIIGKSAYQIAEKDAMNYVWGYTIINDVTARERQRDHKQFYIGKSPDTFCPMGPVAVPAGKLHKTLRVQTYVNGEERQNATTDDLIFSVAFLIKTLSAGQTLQAGDVIATGTPAGVGFGQKPPVWLKPGDIVEIAVTGLGTLRNTVSDHNPTPARVIKATSIPVNNLGKTSGVGLTSINSKDLYYRKSGRDSGPPIMFVHGLGGSSEFFTPIISSLALDKTNSLHQLDLEGHGLSPTSATSTITISSYADDFHALTQMMGLHKVTIIAHSMGCLIALDLATRYPDLVTKLVLLGPPQSPIPEIGRAKCNAMAASVRREGMTAVVDAIVLEGTSEKSRSENPLCVAAIRMSLLGQDPEGYAKGCTALAAVSDAFSLQNVKAKTLIITGNEDKVSSPAVCESYRGAIQEAQVKVLNRVGHWHVLEDLKRVSEAVGSFLN